MYLKSNLPKNKNSHFLPRKKLNPMNQLNCCQLMFVISVLLVIANCFELLMFFNYSLSLKDGQTRLEIKNSDDRKAIHQLEETFIKEIKDLRAEIEKMTQVIII